MDIEALYQLFKQSTGVSVDTRTLVAGNIFFSLRGPNFDGNAFADQALAAGALAAVVDDGRPPQERFIVVDDALHTLQQLARWHRNQLRARVIGIAGSNGKTTTKELTAAILATTYRTYATRGNRNNHIGVPLSILEITPETEFAVLEIGASRLGETAFLCALARLDWGLVTNNGKDHLEGYGSTEAVQRGNAELYDYLRTVDGLAFVSADDEQLMRMSQSLQRVTYGMSAAATVRGSLRAVVPGLTVVWEGRDITTGLYGRYNFSNIMAAISIGKTAGVPQDNIGQALQSYVPQNNRSQRVSFGGNQFILDAYNANPSSMSAALEDFFAYPATRKMVILGDMAELGSATVPEHKAIVDLLRQHPELPAILVGPAFRQADPANFYMHFDDVDAMKAWFFAQPIRDYFILVKGSRRLQLERLLEPLPLAH